MAKVKEASRMPVQDAVASSSRVAEGGVVTPAVSQEQVNRSPLIETSLARTVSSVSVDNENPVEQSSQENPPSSGVAQQTRGSRSTTFEMVWSKGRAFWREFKGQ